MNPGKDPPPASTLEQVPLLERWGVSTLVRDRQAQKGWPTPEPAGVLSKRDSASVHLLSVEERRELDRITRRGVIYAAALGAVSAGISSISAIVAETYFPLGDALWGDDGIAYWAIFGGATGVAAVIEIALLYWDALAQVRRMADATGLSLTASESLRRRSVAAALARAALELPAPTEPAFGVDPLREANRIVLLLAGLVYKAKIALTGFLVKLVLRRALGRAAARWALAWVGVPVTAIWNAAVCWIVLRDARVALLGPSAAAEFLLQRVLPRNVSTATGELCFRAVATAIVRNRTMHPNHWALLALLEAELGTPTATHIDDPARFFAKLPTLPATERTIVLDTLLLSCLLDGHLSRRDRRLLGDAARAANASFNLGGARSLTRRYRHGEPMLPHWDRLAPFSPAEH